MPEEFKSPSKVIRSPEQLAREKERFLNDFRRLRFDFLEEFPKERLMPDMPNYHLYKCRTNFFSAILIRIVRLKQLGLVNSQETKKECKEFNLFCDSIRGTGRFYVQEDIDKANKVLDSLIKELSS